MATKLIIDGIVQGVFCRYYCSQYAKRLRIRGSASNMRDGTVRVLLDTDDPDLINEYRNALKNNPRGERFYGTIETIEVSSYSGPLYGDYSF